MKTFISILFTFLVLGVFGASIWYVSYRLRVLLGINRRWPMRLGVGAGFIASLAAMLAGAQSTNEIVGLMNILGGYFFSFYIFTTLLLLAVHIAQLKWDLPSKETVLSIMAIAMGLTMTGALWANSFRVSKIEIPLRGLQQDIVLMHISDIHIGHHRGKQYLAEIVAQTNRHQPDIVLLNGDLVDSNVALLPGVLDPLSDFDAPVYFTSGNHDEYVDTNIEFDLLEKHGVRILHNEVVETHGIYLVGLDYMNPDDETFDMHPSQDKRTIKSILPDIDLKDDKPSVLMHHSPVGIQYVAAKGIDLMLAGHTHGGQMFPGTLIMPFFFPHNKGLHREGKTFVFTSVGAGTYGPRIRLGTSNEINLVRLKGSK